ncbi:LysR family transcriptional regulator [Shewanella yunxiaonensis]|uniref:LysR family transcriptional regulator n=1 Tax=Shewanella yunxiaonensis TaxID=2829809 RepID=A0ABX7YS78_9GAMM|nr:LysR family transcriptional regulator [Shewanella yunxiaonensis]QUN05497.1 LysR family transcriptional regulator [Shewanella yunxiaonensis]
MINPQWLQTFTVLSEMKNFTRTAERLGITQAAVSQQMRLLEQQFGHLLARRGREMALTPAGVALLQYQREVENAENRLQMRLTEAEATCGDVGIVSPGSIGLRLYPLLLELQQQHAGLVLRHRFAPDPEVLEVVLSNKYELGLTSTKPDDPRLSASRFTEEPLELVIPADKTVDSWQDLMQLGFIDHPDGRAMATRLLSRCFPGNPGISSLPITGFSNQVSLLLEPVARGLGFTVLPHFARISFAKQPAIKVVETPVAVVDTLWLIHRQEWPLSSRAEKVVAYLRQALCGSVNTTEPT